MFGAPDSVEVVGADARKGAFFPTLLFYAKDPFAASEPHDVEALQGDRIERTYASAEDAIELRVSDEGSGVPEALRARIFDPFVQLEAGASASRSGRGLGLAFCRMAVAAHGGTIEIEPTTVGATFLVRLPQQFEGG